MLIFLIAPLVTVLLCSGVLIDVILCERRKYNTLLETLHNRWVKEFTTFLAVSLGILLAALVTAIIRS
jgi:hypothetical protein